MKTKIKLLVIVGLLFCAGNSAMAQMFRYNASGQHFVGNLGNSVWYQADVDDDLVILYNRENRLTYARQTIDGRPSTAADVKSGMLLLERDTWTRALAMRIVNEAFTPAQIREIQRGETMIITMFICSQTGEVMEVSFQFSNRSGYATVPAATFRRIELALKEQLRFTPTADGRRLNFVARGWPHQVVPNLPQRSPDNRPTPPTPPSNNQPSGGSSGPGDSGDNRDRTRETELLF